MLSNRTVTCARVMAVITAMFGLGCGSNGSDKTVGSGAGGSNDVTAVGGRTSPASSVGGGSTQSGGSSSSGASTTTSTSSSAQGGAPAGGSSGQVIGGSSAGGQSTSLQSGGTQPIGGQSATGPSGGTEARGGQSASVQTGGAPFGGAASGGTAAGGTTSTNGGALPRGGSSSTIGGASVGGTSANGGGQSTGGTRATGGTPTYGGGGATSLYKKYADYFPIGAAVDDKSYTTHADLLTKHFNSITMEDQMKFDALEPSEGSFNYATADKIASFATTNNMKIRGHTLVWHRQNPSWVFTNSSGGAVTKDVLLARLKNHITNVMKHFQGKVYAWDVVNEAIMETGAYRTGDEAKDDQKSQWYKIVGESYVAEAFKYAHDADPNAKLFYNDYYDYIPAKRQGIYKMLKGLLDSGVTVHGVGLQTHLNIEPSSDTTNQAYYQKVSELEEAIKLYSSLGLEVQITEMDLSLYIPGVTYTTDTFYTQATFTDAIQAKQAERYREFFTLFRQYQGTITGVTLWGIADDNTWLSEFSSGRKDFPLLFDTNHQAKKAYYAVVDF